jgi:uncharacterized protein (DUF2384 family)
VSQKSYRAASDKSRLAIIANTDIIAPMTDNVVDHLSKLFGTQTKLAMAAGVKQNTMSERRQTNSLSHQQMRRILKVAPEMGVEVTPDDFFPEFAARHDARALEDAQ